MRGGYDIICADPPWKFASNSDAKPGRNARRHYDCMTAEQLAALPVADWAAKNSLLFLWVTVPWLEKAMDIARGWEFRYVSHGVWDKGAISTGYWFRNQHEPVLLYRRGRFPWPGTAPFPTSIITAPRREHSRKPDELQDRIDAVWPDASKLELFGRRERPGWTAWGNDVGRFSA